MELNVDSILQEMSCCVASPAELQAILLATSV